MQTTLRLDGANCSLCFNDVLDHLRHGVGVRHVEGSISESLIKIDHSDDVGLDELVEIVRPYAHGVKMYANEVQMIHLEAVDASTPCSHQRQSPEQPPTG